MLASLKNKLRLSQAARVTLCFCLALTLLTISAWCIYQFDPRRVAWGDYMTTGRLLTLLAMLCLTLVSVYWATRFWLEENPVEENPTRNAWNSGQQHFARMGSRMQDQPLFLVIGNESRQAQRQLLTAAGENIVFETPQVGDAPLTWFATARATYLCCTGMGVLGPTLQKLQALSDEALAAAPCKITESLTRKPASIAAQTAAESETDGAIDAKSPTRLSQGTESEKTASVGGELQTTTAVAELQPKQLPETKSPDSIRRAEASLIRAESLVSIFDQTVESQALPVATTTCSAEPLLHSTELLHGQRELLQLATQLKSGRQPTVAVNGITVMVDQGVIRTDTSARHCGRAIRQDLALLETVCGVRAPTSLLITGAEKLPGINETIRRLGVDAASQRSMGKNCDPRAELNENALSAFADQCADSLGHCAHELLGDSDALTQPGNAQLAQLLLASRGRFANCLHALLQEAFGDRVRQTGKPTFLSGVFLSANGNTPTQRGFSRPALHGSFAQQQFVEWTGREQSVQRRTNLAIACLLAFCLANATVFLWQILA